MGQSPSSARIRPAAGRYARRVAAASAARVAPGGETGRRTWLVPALAVVVVLFAALNVRAAQDGARRATDAATQSEAAASDVVGARALADAALTSPSPASGAPARLTRALTLATRELTALQGTAPADSSASALATAAQAARASVDHALAPLLPTPPGSASGARARLRTRAQIARVASLAGAVEHDLAARAEAADALQRRRLDLTLIGGLLLAALLMWSFWAKRTRLAVEQSEHRFRSLIERSTELVALVDDRHRIRVATPAFDRKLGHAAAELVGSSLLDLLHPEDREGVDLADPGAGEARPHWRLRHQDGSWHETEAEWVDLRDDPAVGGYVVTMHDIGGRTELRDQLRWQAFHDVLTGLANRTLFEDRVAHALERGRRSGDAVAVLFVDLDDFKAVNDSLGHAPGDELLREFSLRLGECIRRADTAARFGGDEFAVLVEGADAAEAAAVVAQRIHESLERPFALGHDEVFVHASIGIAIGRADTVGEDLLRNADIAMYAAKNEGKGRSATFKASMHTAARMRLQLSSDLRRAVRDGVLTVKYQPLVRLTDGKLLGAEALVRWPHETLGEIQPDDFIPLAEETGLIVPIGRFVLEEACRQLAGWIRDHPGQHPDYVSVNLSGRQFQPEGQVVRDVQAAADAAGIDPSRLMLEITESILMHDREAVVRDLTALRDLGARIAIDDFGTGYSALSYLRQFPIDTVKMDRSFVRNLGTGKADAALIRSVVELGEALNMQIVAEGIEGQGQLDSVAGLRCDVGQGYFFAPPLDPAGMRSVMAGEWPPGLRDTTPAAPAQRP